MIRKVSLHLYLFIPIIDTSMPATDTKISAIDAFKAENTQHVQFERHKQIN